MEVTQVADVSVMQIQKWIKENDIWTLVLLETKQNQAVGTHEDEIQSLLKEFDDTCKRVKRCGQSPKFNTMLQFLCFNYVFLCKRRGLHLGPCIFFIGFWRFNAKWKELFGQNKYGP